MLLISMLSFQDYLDKSNQEPNLNSAKDALKQITNNDDKADKIRLNPEKMNAKLADLLNRSLGNQSKLNSIREQCQLTGEVWDQYQSCLDDLLTRIRRNKLTFDLAVERTADTDSERLKLTKFKLEVNIFQLCISSFVAGK